MAQEDKSSNVARIRNVTWWGMLVNILLSIFKFIVGYLGSSQAVIADAVHSLSDMSTDVAVIFGVKFWSAPPDEGHPYGHQRIEALVTMAIGLALASVAVGLGYNSLSTIHDEHLTKIGWVAVFGPVLSIFSKEWLYHWTVGIGIKVKSTAVVANAWHHRSDALSSIPALVAVVVSALYPDWAFMDHVGAVIIAVFILKVSWDIIYPALQELSDAGACENTRNHIEKIAMAVKNVKSVHAIRTRKFGSGLYIDLHVLVDPNMSVHLAHNIAEEVKTQLFNDGPDVLDVVVHIEPYDTENLTNE